MNFVVLLVSVVIGLNAPRQDPTIPLVEPEQLTRNPDLIGREVTVDDRVLFYQSHRGPGGKQIYDELLLKRTPVIFKLPPALRPDRPPREPVARVQGVLRQEGKQVYCDVQSVEMLPADLTRFEKELTKLSPRDNAGRLRWADWGAKRGKAFKDEPLIRRAREVESEAILADAQRQGADLLTLSKSARAKGLDAALAGGLAHAGYLQRLAEAKTSADLARLAKEVDEALPDAADPKGSKIAGLEEWLPRYKINPTLAYRDAPPPIRAALDRKLLADIVQQRLERRAGEEPSKTMNLADEARTSLPDRPEVAAKLRTGGLASSEASVASMRLSEVEALAKTFRDEQEDGRAKKLLAAWLEDQRLKKLSAGDADGRILLASHYLRLLDDRLNAAALLREAVRIDPNSRDAADAFRRLGYKKSTEGEWVESRPTPPPAVPLQPTAPSTTPANETPPASDPEKTLIGLTPAQVKRKIGAPDKITRSATNKETIEQWIYQRPKGFQIINFKRPRIDSKPQVVASYSFP